ncbi:hypothetical protein B0H15DRAFT_847725 [Mycena belliarum]|uniref:Uncharacterized protein n=1 Tax=Mycena belliarum TaxID=1033014 RepID=A0AAD6U3X0_9AGAR|nr:hypothetical protein B0H15DRAFT_847725 [Mycena belliae]
MESSSPPPPSYTSPDPPSINAPSSAVDAPPAYSVPTRFQVGAGRSTKPFVNVPQTKDHLALLHAFAKLKLEVEGKSDMGIAYLPPDKERRWGWFVGHAVERFEKWCKALQPSHSEKGLATLLPPLDVLMVWHAYLLNPGWYAEDGIRIKALKGLQSAGAALALALGGDLGQLLASEPSKQRVDNWIQMTATPFDPFEAATQTVSREIACPKCRAVVYAPYITEAGTGYLQQGFAIQCPSDTCSFEITKETLAMRKLVSDLAKHEPSDVLAGTLYTPTNVNDLERGQTVKAAMLSSYSLKRAPGKQPKTVISDTEYADFLMAQGQYKLSRLRTFLSMKMKGGGGRLIGRVLSAYVDDKMFSVELVGAILRQGSFVAKMYDLQWTQPGFFDSTEDEVALQHAIARYHAFLDLMSSSPASFFVPTLDIDLAWHTHQLMASRYSRDTIKHVRRFIDHDDKVEESQLASAFDITCRAWKDRFGVQYTHCGCPIPGETIGQKLSRLVGPSRPGSESYLVPPERGDLRAATHPSDHNAVFAFHKKAAAEAARRVRQQKLAKRAQREGGGTGTGTRAQHDAAFLVPVPLYYMPFAGAGVGCAAVGAHVVNNGGACGGGACAAVNPMIFLFLPRKLRAK